MEEGKEREGTETETANYTCHTCDAITSHMYNVMSDDSIHIVCETNLEESSSILSQDSASLFHVE